MHNKTDIINKKNYLDTRKIVFNRVIILVELGFLSLSPFNYYISLCRGAENGGKNLNN